MRPRTRAGDAERRRGAYRLGLSAEAVASFWLRLQGFRILDRRNARGPAEIDIVARRGRLLVFTEVKARATLAGGLAAVSAAQRRRIVRAAEGFVAANGRHAGCDIRFDVIVVRRWRLPHHLAGAFDAGR